MKALLPSILFLALASSLVEAKDCLSARGQALAEHVLKINRHRNVWPGYDQQRVIFVFSDPRTSRNVVLGLQRTELLVSSVRFTDCETHLGETGFLIEEAALNPDNGLYSIRTIDRPGHDSLAKIVQSLRLTLIQIQEPNRFGFEAISVARIAIHEGFHGAYQFSSGRFEIEENPPPRDFLTVCRKNTEWLGLTLSEHESLIMSLSEKKESKLRALAAEVHALRSKIGLSAETMDCILAQRFWERIEGTAHFLETESARLSGFTTYPEIHGDINAVLADTHLKDLFFYRSGNALIRLAKRLKVSKWSERIDKGEPLDAIF